MQSVPGEGERTFLNAELFEQLVETRNNMHATVYRIASLISHSLTKLIKVYSSIAVNLTNNSFYSIDLCSACCTIQLLQFYLIVGKLMHHMSSIIYINIFIYFVYFNMYYYI